MTYDPQIVEPIITRTGDLSAARGVFFRSVDRQHAADALKGSFGAGRYSRPDQPTLYLSASRTGVAAAMRAHPADPSVERLVLAYQVEGDCLYDLRDSGALAMVSAAAGDPFGDWKSMAAVGREPSSWRVRDWIEARGAVGLIDPSRAAPGLWHLVLFRWNVPGAPRVTSLDKPNA